MFIIITVTKEKANAFSPWISCLEKDSFSLIGNIFLQLVSTLTTMDYILCVDIMSGRLKYENLPQFNTDWLASLRT